MQLVASLSSPCSLVVDLSLWVTCLLAVAVRHIFCGLLLVLFFLLVMLPSEIPKLPTDLSVRGFPLPETSVSVRNFFCWKLLLLHNSLLRVDLHP